MITNGLHIALELGAIPAIRVMMRGGLLRPSSHSLVGPGAEQMLAQLSADRLFLGVDGIDPVEFHSRLASRNLHHEIARDVRGSHPACRGTGVADLKFNGGQRCERRENVRVVFNGLPRLERHASDRG